MYSVQEEITVKVSTMYSVQGDMTRQNSYEQCTQRYDETIRACTVFKYTGMDSTNMSVYSAVQYSGLQG